MPRLDRCKLRTLKEEDLGMVLEWRNSYRIRSNMYNDKMITIDEHINWFMQLDNQKEVYLVFEIEECPVGLVYFKEINWCKSSSYWGFYLGETGLPLGSGLVMGYLGIDYAFDELGLKKLCGEVLSFNQASIKFHLRFGFVEEGILKRHVFKNGIYQDVITFALFKEDWESKKEELRLHFDKER